MEGNEPEVKCTLLIFISLRCHLFINDFKNYLTFFATLYKIFVISEVKWKDVLQKNQLGSLFLFSSVCEPIYMRALIRSYTLAKYSAILLCFWAKIRYSA